MFLEELSGLYSPKNSIAGFYLKIISTIILLENSKFYLCLVTLGFIFGVYLSMVTLEENLSMMFSQPDVYQLKMSEENFETHISPIRELLIALQSLAAQTFHFFLNTGISSEYDH